MQPTVVQFYDLLRIQLTNWRWSWRSHLLLSTITPLLSAAALGIFAGSGTAERGTLLMGSVVMSLLFGTAGQLGSHFSFIRYTGQLDFFATLPIHRWVFVLASACAFVCMALPPAVVTLAAGAALLGVPLTPQPGLLAALPVVGLSLCGVGILIAERAPTMQSAGLWLTLVNFLLSAPALIPAERMPESLRFLNQVSPAAYAAAALRQSALGTVESLPLWANLALLTLTGCLLLAAAAHGLDWRKPRT